LTFFVCNDIILSNGNKGGNIKLRGNINSNKGITLVALILYIIVTIIVISMLSLVMTHFRNNLGNVDEKSVQEAEFDKLNLYLLKEVKEEDNFVVTVMDDNEDGKAEKLVLFNGNTYTFVESEKAIYLNNNIKAAQGIDSCEFSYEDDERKRQETLTVKTTINGQQQIREYIFTREIYLTEPGAKATTTSIYRSTNKAAIIPEGFTVSGIDTEQGITTGLVTYIIPNDVDITEENFWTEDENENDYPDVMEEYDQFVWIPVDNINDMYMCQSEDGTKSCKIVVEHNQAICKTHNSTQMAGRLYTSSSNLNSTSQKYGYETKGIEYNEPYKNNHGASYLTQNFAALGEEYCTAEGLANLMQDEYNTIVKSVVKSKGFYISRYETNNTKSAMGISIKLTSWYGAYKSALLYFDNQNIRTSSVKCTMMQGAAYDQIIKYVNGTNYNALSAENVSHDLSSSYKTGGIGYSGTVTYNDNPKNIFDLEGNLREWTSETWRDYRQSVRGGAYDMNYSAQYRIAGTSLGGAPAASNGIVRIMVYIVE